MTERCSLSYRTVQKQISIVGMETCKLSTLQAFLLDKKNKLQYSAHLCVCACVSLCLCLCLSVSLCLILSVSVSLCLCLSVSVSVSLCVSLSLCLSLSVCVPPCFSVSAPPPPLPFLWVFIFFPISSFLYVNTHLLKIYKQTNKTASEVKQKITEKSVTRTRHPGKHTGHIKKILSDGKAFTKLCFSTPKRLGREAAYDVGGYVKRMRVQEHPYRSSIRRSFCEQVRQSPHN